MKVVSSGSKYIFEVVKAKNGEATLKVITSSEKYIFRHSRYNPSREAGKWVNTFDLSDKKNIILMGLGLGYELEVLASRIKEHQRIYVIEKSREIFSFFKKTSPQNEIFNDNRIVFIVNTHAKDLVSIFRNLSPSSSLCILRHPSTETMFSDYYSNVECILLGSNTQKMTAIVLVGKGIVAPFIIKDIAIALKELKCSVEFFPLRRHGEDLLRRAQQVKPDFVFALDGTGLDFPWIRRLSCPKVAWFVDNPFYFLDYIDRNNLLFCWDEDYINDLQETGFKNVYFLPLATNSNIFNPNPLKQSDLEKYACEVSFVGSIGKPKGALYKERNQAMNNMCNDEMHKLFDGLMMKRMKKLLSGRSGHLRDILGSYYDTIDMPTRLFIDRRNDFETGSLLREHVVSVLRSFDCLLFGNQELSRMCSETCRFMGKINYHLELPKLYKACSVNINVTRPQLLSIVNQRIYDISATRSFMLTDYRRFLNNIFSFDINAICFRSLGELNDKVKYYLKNEKERRQIAHEMYKNVILRHTYTQRIKEMLEIIKEFL